MASQAGPSALKASHNPQITHSNQAATALWKKRFEKRHFSSNPVIAKLDVECNELAQTWNRFQENLPSPDQVQLQERLQESDDVLAVVREVQTVWASRPRQRVFRRSMTLCDQFVASFNLHLMLLSALPRNEAYLALFYGVLQSVIKAAANYPRAMEGLITILVQVNESAGISAGEHSLESIKNSSLAIANFYALNFLLLGEWMDWYVRKAKCRLLNSPSLDPCSDFEGLLRNIQTCAKDIARASTDGMDLDTCDEEVNGVLQKPDRHLWEQARLSQAGLQKWDRRFASQSAITRQVIWEIQHDASERARLRVERDAHLSKLLDSASQRLRPTNEQQSGIACLTTAATRDLDGSRFHWLKGPKRKYTRVDLQFASKHLEDFFDSDDQMADFDAEVNVVAEDSVVKSLQQWATDPHSQMLAVAGSPSTDPPCPVALFSACFASFSRQARLPAVSHFCSIPDATVEGLTQSQQGLIALAYSMIRQLIDYLPPVLESHEGCDLSQERFASLNGTLSSWTIVLSLIDALLHYAPPLLVCVIDGLDILHDESTDPHIRSFVRTLMTHTKHQADAIPDGTAGQNVLLKVLFTVAGRPSALVETLSEDQLILNSESNGVNQPASADAAPTPDVGVVLMNA